MLEKLKGKFVGKYFKTNDNSKYIFVKDIIEKEVVKITLYDFDEMINSESELEFPEFNYVGVEINLKKHKKYYSMQILRGTFNFTLDNPFFDYKELPNTQWHKEIDAFNIILLNTLG